jgi:hypothetical protein
LTFTEAPAAGDVIDVRMFTTTTSVTSISNAAGNAVVGTSETAANVLVTGNLIVSGPGVFVGDGSGLTNLNVSGNTISSGTSKVDVISVNGNVNTVIANTIVQTVSSGQVAVTGNLTVGTGTITGGNIVNANGNGIGNIGSSSVYFNTVFAKATSAQYADLAEKYEADAEYAPGTVLAFGGDKEVTLSTEAGSTRVAGVVSTNPSYIMNAGLTAEHVAMVALQGRVPCRVVGPVAKGDMMVAAGNGAARVDNSARAGSIIGKALENFDGAEGTIEVVIGRN